MPNQSMTLSEWLHTLEKRHPKDIDLGLDRVDRVYRQLGIAEDMPYAIVVAGTNGKGSTVSAIQRGLSSAGLKVGTYTSPHIERFNERIALCGNLATDQELVSAFERVELARGEVSLTYFEFTTLAAFVLFAGKSALELDAVVCEVGLGGRLDAVNVLDADVAVITSIGLDHQDWLGDSLEAIAKEKAGILREGRPGLIGECFPSNVLTAHEEQGFHILQFKRDFGYEYPSDRLLQTFLVKGDTLGLNCVENNYLPQNNLCLAMQACIYALQDLGLSDSSNVYQLSAEAIASTSVPGRLDIVRDDPPIIMDVAHNGAAASFLGEFVNRRFGDHKPLFVFSCFSDKNIQDIVSGVQGQAHSWYIAQLDSERAMSVQRISEALEQAGESFSCFGCLDEAMDAADRVAKDQSRAILVFGSFSVLEQLREKARSK